MNKTKIFSALLILVIAMLMLFSCSGGNNDNGNNGNNGGGENENDTSFIYNDKSELYIVTASGEVDTDIIADTVKDIIDAIGRTPKIRLDDSETAEHELVIGKTSRPLSEAAYAFIEEPDDYNSASYVIYSDGNSIAIAYNGEGSVALKMAIDYLITNHFTEESLTLNKGVVHFEEIDLGAYYQAIDDALLEEEWAELAAAFGGELGDEVVAAMKDLYSLYDDNMIAWFANLYDPAVGGYYYSNSGRDNEGFLPDIESTAQALNFISNSGLVESIGGSYTDALTDEMKAQIVSFIKGLQDPNGYFYHPQWTRTLSDSKKSRLARDLGNAVSVLKALGSAPTYNTPNGDKGDGLLVDGTPAPAAAMLTGRLGTSTVQAVSQVVATATTYMKELENKETFLAYLDALDIQNKSYSAGNTLTSIMNQIVTRDKALAEAGADYSLVDILIDYLNKRQNPENGTWHAENNYYAVNGLMKTSGVYSKAGVMLPYAKEALQSAIDAIFSDEEIDAVTSIYNTWFTIRRIRNITNSYGSAEEKAEIGAMLEEFNERVPDAIRATMAKVAVFRKPDGSFSYTPNASSANSQGCPVAVPGTNEGDVNATVICSSDILVYIYGALDISDKYVSIYTYNDWRYYKHLLETLPPVVKNELPVNDEPITFEDDGIGEVPVDVTTISNSNGGSITVVDDGRGGKAAQIVSAPGGNDYISVSAGSVLDTKVCSVFEADFRLDSSATNYPIQIFMGECYMFTIRTANGKVNIVESSSGSSSLSMDNTLKLTPELGEWFNIRVEYYYGDKDSVRIKFYYNKELVAVTDNYYDNIGAKLKGEGEPSNSYGNAKIFMVKAADATLLVDNVRAYKTSDKYVAEPDKDLVINVDGKSDDEKKRDNIINLIPENLETYYKNETVAGTRYDFTDDTLTKYDASTNPNGFMISDFNEEANNYILSKRVKFDTSYDDLYVSAGPSWVGLSFANKGEVAGNAGDKYVAEMSFTWLGGTPSKASDPSPAFFGFFGNDTINNNGMPYYSYLSLFNDDTDKMDFCGTTLSINCTYSIRMEHVVGSETVEIYVNGAPTATYTFKANSKASDAKCLGFGFYFRSRMTDPFEFIVDDVFVGTIPAAN